MYVFMDAFPGVSEEFKQDPRHMVEWHFRLFIGYSVVRSLVLGIKYAYVAPVHYGLMMRSRFGEAWKFNSKIMLTTAWLYPQHDVLHREIGLAAARRQVHAERYEVKLDSSLRDFVHAMLLPMLDPHGLTAEAAKLQAQTVGTAMGKDGSALEEPAVIDDSKTSTNALAVEAGQCSARHDPHKTIWEKRLSRGRVRISDLAVAIQMAASNDPQVKPKGPFKQAFFTAFIILMVPYAVYAARGELTTGHVSSYNVALHVMSNLAAFFNIGSLMLFFVISVFDYLRRSAAQSVLTQLARPVPSEVFKGGVNLLFPFALSRFLLQRVPMDSFAATEAMAAAAEGGHEEDLEAEMQDSALDSDGDDVRSVASAPPTVPLSQEHETAQSKTGAAPAKQAEDAYAQGATVVPQTSISSQAYGVDPVAAAAEDTTAAQASLDSDAASRPPIIDVTRPSNAFAWLRLRELTSEIGLHFQLRMQLYLAVAVLLVVMLDIGAVSRILTPGSTRGVGTDPETDILLAQAVMHTAVMLGLVVLCIIFGALANSQASKQAEALMHAGVELEEVARELQEAMRRQNTGQCAPSPSQAPWVAHASGRTVPKLGPDQSDGSALLRDDVSVVPTCIHSKVPQLALPPSTAGQAASSARPYTHPAVGSVYTARSALQDSAHAGPDALHKLPPAQLAAMMSGICSAATALRTVIRSLRIHAESHPVRVVGVPASFTLVKVIFTIVFTALAVLFGGGASAI